MHKVAEKSSRIATLDLMRGYFIFVIIADHLVRWPSPLAWVTGQGRLWVSAAEGFFIISGLLVGYTRGFKLKNKPLREVVRRTWSRAALLYAIAVVVSAVLMFILARVSIPAELGLPLPADTSITSIIWLSITQQRVNEWIYFLRLYWIVLLISPLFVYLWRKGRFALSGAISIIVWLLGILWGHDWMQWQILFFIPGIAGYNLETMRKVWNKQTDQTRKRIKYTFYAVGLGTLILSSYWVFGWSIVESPKTPVSYDSYVATRSWLDPVFSKQPLSLGRITLSMIWFWALFLFVRSHEKWFLRFTGWLLLPLGKFSLSAYVLQGFVVLLAQLLVPVSGSNIINTTVTVVCILIIAGIVSRPQLHRFLLK